MSTFHTLIHVFFVWPTATSEFLCQLEHKTGKLVQCKHEKTIKIQQFNRLYKSARHSDWHNGLTGKNQQHQTSVLKANFFSINTYDIYVHKSVSPHLSLLLLSLTNSTKWLNLDCSFYQHNHHSPQHLYLASIQASIHKKNKYDRPHPRYLIKPKPMLFLRNAFTLVIKPLLFPDVHEEINHLLQIHHLGLTTCLK
jgi:hypothetical protein